MKRFQFEKPGALAPVNIRRLEELESMACEAGARFYTLEVTLGRRVNLAFHAKEIFGHIIEGGDGVAFEAVLDEA